MFRVLHHPRLLLAALVFCCLLPSVPVMAQGSAPTNYVAGEVVFRLVPGADVRAVARRHRLKMPESGEAKLDRSAVYRLTIADGVAPPAKSAALATDPAILYAEPNYLGQTPEARQRSSWAVGDADMASVYQSQWAPEKLRLRDAHAAARGLGLAIAILDTGADLSHPALLGHLSNGYDFVDDDADPSEAGTAGVDLAFGHGTHVAGLAALVAPDAQLMILRTLSADGTGTIWDQIRALRWAEAHGADVINLSWSFSTRSKALDDVLAEVTCAKVVTAACRSRAWSGAVVVAAAGNSGTRLAEYPAASQLPGVISVAASTEADTLAAFSSYGPWVSLAAPGDHIVSSVPGGAYASWSGTSMATPLTAGVVALLRTIRPSDRPSELISRLVTASTTIDGPVQRRITAAVVMGRRP
jgi:subtilisin family serine protease